MICLVIVIFEYFAESLDGLIRLLRAGRDELAKYLCTEYAPCQWDEFLNY